MQFASGTGSASTSNFDIAWQRGGRGNFPKFVMPLDFEQRHRGSINLDYRLPEGEGPVLFGANVLENAGINLLFSFNSGTPYTRMQIFNTLPFTGRYDNDGVSETPLTAVNEENTPWNFKLDLKIDKEFKLPFLESRLKVYLWVLNVLNTENLQAVWITTGLGNDTGFLSTTAGQEYYNALTDEQKLSYLTREMDYNNYGNPRQIRLGARISF
jgi:hypothetical protein